MTSVRSAASTALPPIRAAVARSKREAIRRELENCQLLAGIWCHGLTWEPLRPCAKGMNAWLFVHSDDIPPALNPYRHFQREWKLALNDFTGAVYEGRLYGPDDFAALEAMPTRLQSYAYLLGCLHTPAVSLLGVLQAAPVQPAPAPPPAPPPKEES
uniref:Uncharacterized protein n=1 Tax=Ananas comosus var. bracteatus TaxID=296719 RepID=A0A6V7QGN6_ANACO|nr:unnamed protein product [Ananas comosus var. bracteatus]